MSRLTALELKHLRADQLALMGDTCRIKHVADPAELDSDEVISTEAADVVYEGLCNITPIVARRDRFDEFGEGLIYQVQYRLLLPFDAIGFIITDRVEILTSADADLFARDFEIRDIHRVSDISQRRLTLHDIER